MTYDLINWALTKDIGIIWLSAVVSALIALYISRPETLKQYIKDKELNTILHAVFAGIKYLIVILMILGGINLILNLFFV